MTKTNTEFYGWEKDDDDEYVNVDWLTGVFDEQDEDLATLADQVAANAAAAQSFATSQAVAVALVFGG